MFNSNSFTVRFYVGKIQNEGFPVENVPNLFNLKDEVNKLVAE